MTVYNANLLSLRTKIEKRQAVIKKAIAKAKQRIKEGESDPRSAAARHVKANKTNLGRAEKVLDGLNGALASLQAPCCNNDLNCNPEVL
jgi:hypothetical protein